MDKPKKNDSLSPAEEKYLSEIYGDPAKVGSLGGAYRLYQAVKKEGKYKITLKQVKEWLRKIDTYTLHRPINRKFPRNRVIVGGINEQWSADLGDMNLFKKYNKNFKYFLLVIDVFSKFVRTAALKTKTAKEVTAAFKKMLPKKKGVPESLHTDRGTEFTNTSFQNLLKEHKIKHFFTSGELKAMVAERAIKTIKLKFYQYFTESRKLNWVDHMNDITNTYNHSIHRTIGMAPADVTPSKTSQIWEKTYPEPPLKAPEPFKFELNDKVRISFAKVPFERAYNYHWTGEIFIVSERFHKQLIAKYKLKDWDNVAIDGTFYTDELQKVNVSEDSAFKIEKILGRRMRNGQREYKIKWYLWPEKYNSWVPARNIINYQ